MQPFGRRYFEGELKVDLEEWVSVTTYGVWCRNRMSFLVFVSLYRLLFI